MKLFDLNNIPKTDSWIKKLSIEEAREQCKLWGIKPKDKLDAMRVQLNEFVARSSEGVVSDLEEPADEPRLPVTDDLVDDPSMKQDELETCTVLPPVTPVDLSGLVKSLHTMTLHAIEATAKTVAQEMATHNRPNNRDDVSFPNILRDMLREVPITSGTDLFQLTEFLVKIQKIVELNLGSDKTILLNAVARTEGRLRDVWMGLVSADYTWPNALQTIRLTLFSSTAIRDIQSKLMYRQQRLLEPYADYLTDIVSIFQILGPEISDAEIFSTIFTGLNPHTRAAFAGLQAPTTVQQLKNMVSLIEFDGQQCSSTVRGNSLKGPAFPKKTRHINPLAPALPKVKPLEIPITFSNINTLPEPPVCETKGKFCFVVLATSGSFDCSPLQYLPPTSPPTQNTGFRSVAVFRSSDLHCVLKTCRSLIPYSSDNAQIVYGLTDRWFVTRHN
ncbi:hypothetical protein J6590_073475 [Homalodisca vitripennis]|nr:hypothetical protein J6590_073475 [Homalodisca vitripennis]